jgi:hypothetical protein
MLYKRKRRTRRIVVLQKKEELLETNDSCSFIKYDPSLEGSNISDTTSQFTNKEDKMSPEQVWSRRWRWTKKLSNASWTNSPIRSSINLFTLGLFLLSIFSYKIEVQGQPPPLPPAGVSVISFGFIRLIMIIILMILQ